MKKIIVIRHCSAAGQEASAPLTEVGEVQAQKLKAHFLQKNFQIYRIVASPYDRAVNSLRPLAEALLLPIEINEHLKERVLSDKPLDNWLDLLKQSFDDKQICFEGGESSNEAQDRVMSVLDSELDRMESGQTLLMVTHGNLMALLLNHFNNHFGFDEWRKLSNPDAYLITISNNQNTIERIWE